MSLNKVMLIGRLGRDPELRYLDNNVGVARFSIATSETYKDSQGQKVEKTEWHNIVVWRKLAEIAGNYLKKGSLVYLEGKLRTRSWDDKSGEKKYATEVVADDFRMLERRSDSEGGGMPNPAPQAAQQQGSSAEKKPAPQGNSSNDAGSFDDDLPF